MMSSFRFLAMALVCGFVTFPFSADATAPAELGDDPQEIQQGAWGDTLQWRLNQGGSVLSEALFDLLENIELDEMKLGDDGKFEFRIGRKVYDNHDTAQTYSVLDRVRMKFSIPVYSADTGLAGGTLGWGIGTEEGFELINIRQSRRRPLNEIFSEFRGRRDGMNDWFRINGRKFLEKTEGSDPVRIDEVPEDLRKSLLPMDPLRTAQFSKLFNLLTFPVRLPLKTEWLSQLEDGEIMAYSVNGAIELGVGVGWSLDPTSLTDIANVGVSVSTYLNGEYRISILKENERFVRVKVGRLYSQGVRGRIGADAKSKILDGFIVSSWDIKLNIIPFRLDVDASAGRSFDVGYRYDLTDPLARKAYEQAVMGRFSYSEDLSKGAHGKLGKPPVERLFTRESVDSGRSSSTTMKLSFILSNEKSSGIRISDAKITFPDGTYNVYRAITENSDEFKTVWGLKENFRYKYTSFVDKDASRSGAHGSYWLTAEGYVDDSNTSAEELYEYMQRVETMVGKPGVFPRPPTFRPVSEEDQKQIGDQSVLTRIPYGRSSFYFRLALKEPQIRKFATFPRERMWGVLEKAFEVDEGKWSTPGKRALYGIGKDMSDMVSWEWLFRGRAPLPDALARLTYAQMFVERWEKLSKISDSVSLSRAMSRLFMNSLYGYPTMRALRIALADEKIAFIVSGTNFSFGHIWKEEEIIAEETVFDRIQREIDFDKPWVFPVIDLQSELSGMGIQVLQEGRIRITFYSKTKPKFVYFRTDEIGLFNNPIRAELIVNNDDGKFTQGFNELILDAKSGGVDQKLLEQMKPGLEYRISLAVSRDGKTWGSRQDEKFRYLWGEAITPSP